LQPQRTVQQYRAIDLSLFALVLILFETVLCRASAFWFPQEPWTVSAAAVITATVMIRWGPWAVLHAVIGGLVFCLANRGSGPQFVIYCAGNTAALALLPAVRKLGWERLRGNALLLMLYGVLTALAMQAGRAAVSMLFGASPASAAGFITTDAVTCIFTAVILWILSRLDGMLEDQKHYLARIHDPKNREGGIA
jgi:hypothetical protein